jgi:hypothetical protein
VIRVTAEERMLLLSLWTPDGEVLLLGRDPEAGPGPQVHAEKFALGILLAAAEFFS